MRDDLPDWLDAEPEPVAPRGRRSLLVVLAALPWCLVLALVVFPRTSPIRTAGSVGGSAPARDAEPPTSHGPHADAPADATSDAVAQPDTAPPDAMPRGGERGEGGADATAPATVPAPDVDGAPPDADWWLTEHRGNWRISPGEGATASLAVAVARAWLTGIPPRLESAGIAPIHDASYVEHLVVEAVERPEEGAAVVTLLAVVLEVGDHDQTVEARRLGVPVVETPDGPRPGGSPWWLPAPDLTPTDLTSEPVDDPAQVLAALEALEAGGFRELELLSLERTDGWPWVAHVEALSPTADRPWEGAVWLRRHLDGFAVAGAPRGTEVTDPSAGSPSTEEPLPEVEP
jgi:hypothetical protein